MNKRKSIYDFMLRKDEEPFLKVSECVCAETSSRHCQIHQEPQSESVEELAEAYWESTERDSTSSIKLAFKAGYSAGEKAAEARKYEEFEQYEEIDELKAELAKRDAEIEAYKKELKHYEVRMHEVLTERTNARVECKKKDAEIAGLKEQLDSARADQHNLDEANIRLNILCDEMRGALEDSSEFIELKLQVMDAVTPSGGGLNKNDGESFGGFQQLLRNQEALAKYDAMKNKMEGE